MSLKEALFKVQSQISKVHKDGKNPHTKSGYPTLESVLDVISGPLQDNGLIVTQFTKYENEQWVLTTQLCTNDGKECEHFDMPLLGLDNSKNAMQALGSALTYAKRYSLMGYFKLAATDDDAESLNQPTLKFVKQKPFVPKDGKYKGKDISKIDVKEISEYIESVNKALIETGGAKPAWFGELEKFISERETA